MQKEYLCKLSLLDAASLLHVMFQSLHGAGARGEIEQMSWASGIKFVCDPIQVT